MKKLLILWAWLILSYAAPCEDCGEDLACLGPCAYKALVEAHTPDEEHQAALLLAHTWLRGDFVEGIPRLLHPIIGKRAEKDSLRLHAILVLAQAQYRLGRADSAALLYERVAGTEAFPFLRSRAYLGLAGISVRSDLSKALSYAAQAAEIADQLNHPLLTAVAYLQLAYITAEQNNLSMALQYGEKALQAAKAAYDQKLKHWLLEPPSTVYLAATANMAALYADNGRLREAENLYQEVLNQAQQDKVARGQAVIGLAGLYLQKRAFAEAEKLLNAHRSLLQSLPFELRRDALRIQAQLHVAQSRISNALATYEQLIREMESHVQQGQSARIEQLRLLAGLEAQEARLRSVEAARQKERTFYFILGGIGLLTLGMMFLAIRSARRRAAEERQFREIIAQQSAQIEEQARALERQNEELIRISETLAEALASVQESHSAAQRLQRAILPNLEQRLPGSAVFYQPMHEVGGDFYGLVSDRHTQRILFFVGDATGHGVSGAILAGIIASTMQNLFLRYPHHSPRKLLQTLLESVRTVLTQQEETSGPQAIREGADIAMGIADFRTATLHFGLAGRPVWLLNHAGIEVLEGGRRGIDSYTPANYEFPEYEKPLDDNLTLFLFTDGVTDALNAEGKKLGAKALRKLLSESEHFPDNAQALKQKCVKLISDWQGRTQINDDMTFIILPVKVLHDYARQRFMVQV